MPDNRTSEACLALDESMLEAIRHRRSAGESLAVLAIEVGLSWQRLWGILHSPVPVRTTATREALPELRKATKAGPLVERYRPTRLDALCGQEHVDRVLRKYAAAPYPAAFVFEGETGTGKTSAALALAAEVGCDLSQKPAEFGGLHVIASGEQTADTVRETARLMWNSPMYGSGWKVLVVNEADRMHVAAETIWLDLLEAIPPRTTIVFTTNYAGKLSQRFLDRCTRLTFESDGGKLAQSARRLLAAIWKRETGRKPDAGAIAKVVADATISGQLSFRRAIGLLDLELAKEVRP